MKISNKIKIYVISLLLILGVGVLLLINDPTYAKYVSNSIINYNLKSKEFYFSSDNLDIIEVQNVNNLWSGESVHFNVKNSLNKSLITDYNINYNASCVVAGDAATYAECRMNGGQTNSYDGILESVKYCKNITGDGVDVTTFTKEACEAGGYKWLDQLVSADLYFDVILTNSNYTLNDVTINVNVRSTSPYFKTLTGKFMLHKSGINENNISMDFKNYSNYNRLIVTNSNVNSKCVKISWNSANLLIDANNVFSSYNVDANGYIYEIITKVDAKKSKDYIFYNRIPNITYGISEFTMEEVESCS